jgi:hypothetical protein
LEKTKAIIMANILRVTIIISVISTPIVLA